MVLILWDVKRLKMSKMKTAEVTKKSGLIIAAYPGMCQALFTSEYTNYTTLSVYEYDKSGEDWVKDFVSQAIFIITKAQFDVCFIEPHHKVLEYLKSINQEFFIFYPLTPKESILKILAITYRNQSTVANGNALADVVLNHDVNIADVRKYSNAVAFSKGIINDSFLKELLSLDTKGGSK